VKRALLGILLLGGVVTVLALLRQRLRAEVSSDNWVSSYTPGAEPRP
jgi:hypothetical protein